MFFLFPSAAEYTEQYSALFKCELNILIFEVHFFIRRMSNGNVSKANRTAETENDTEVNQYKKLAGRTLHAMIKKMLESEDISRLYTRLAFEAFQKYKDIQDEPSNSASSSSSKRRRVDKRVQMPSVQDLDDFDAVLIKSLQQLVTLPCIQQHIEDYFFAPEVQDRLKEWK